MKRSRESIIFEFIKKWSGKLDSGEPGQSISAYIPIASRKRLCTFEFAQNPIRTTVFVSQIPDDIPAFWNRLMDIDPKLQFLHRVSIIDEEVFWRQDLLVPGNSLANLLTIWKRLADGEVLYMIAARGDIQPQTHPDGRMVFPALSNYRN